MGQLPFSIREKTEYCLSTVVTEILRVEISTIIDFVHVGSSAELVVVMLKAEFAKNVSGPHLSRRKKWFSDGVITLEWNRRFQKLRAFHRFVSRRLHKSSCPGEVNYRGDLRQKSYGVRAAVFLSPFLKSFDGDQPPQERGRALIESPNRSDFFSSVV